MTPPPGYRMLVQLVDAQSEADARQTVWEMYGLGTVVQAVFVAGSVKYERDPTRFVPQKSGWTVYVPQGFVLG